MGDHDDGALKVQEEVLQPVGGGDVQVVGGLVHHEDVGVSEEGLGQQDLHLQPRVHVGHESVVEGGGDAQPLEDAGGVGLGLVAPKLGVLGLELGGLDAVLIGKVLLFIEGVHLPADVVEVLVAHEHRVHDGGGVVLVLILLEHRHPGLGQDAHLAGGGLQLAGEDLQEGGFARAVGADDAVAVALDELQVHMGEKRLAAVL